MLCSSGDSDFIHAFLFVNEKKFNFSLYFFFSNLVQFKLYQFKLKQTFEKMI